MLWPRWAPARFLRVPGPAGVRGVGAALRAELSLSLQESGATVGRDRTYAVMTAEAGTSSVFLSQNLIRINSATWLKFSEAPRFTILKESLRRNV